MDSGIFLFFIILLVPGLWLVFSFRRDIRQRLWFEEQWRIEQQQRAIRIPAPCRPPGHARTPVETAPRAPASRGAKPAEKPTPTDESSVYLESWQDFTASNMGAAFEIFLRETTHPADDIMTSEIDEAFEKFLC